MADLITKIRNTAKKTHFTDLTRPIAAAAQPAPHRQAHYRGYALLVYLEFVGGLAVVVCVAPL
jgi:hypothetical protein